MEYRLKKHLEALKRGNHRNLHLQNSWNKYSAKDFVFTPFYKVNMLSELTEKEQECIKNAYSLGLKIFNIRNPENKAPLTEEHRKRLSDSHKGKVHSLETREKLSVYFKGRKRPPRSEEWKRNIGLGNLGKRMPKEYCEKLSIRMKGNKYACKKVR
jgi:hypothetical protein